MIGGTGAVGRHVVDHLHRASQIPHLTITGRKGNRAAELAAAYGDRATGVALDVRDHDALDRAVASSRSVVTTTEVGAVDLARICAARDVAMVSVAGTDVPTIDPEFEG